MIKRIAAVLLVLILGSSFAVGAEDNINDNSRAVGFLSAAGAIAAGDGENLSKMITKAEFAVILDRLLNNGNESEAEGKNPFLDLDKNDYGYKSIIYLNERGLLVGYDSYFSPEANITCVQAVRVLLSMMGYDKFIGENYPDGYLKQASELGLLQDVSCFGDDEVTLNNAAQLIYNALEAPYVKIEMSGGTISHVIEQDETYMYKLLSIKKSEGIVTGTSMARLFEPGYCMSGAAEIDSESFIVSDESIDRYLGHKILYFYKETDSGEKELVYWEDFRTNKNLTVYSKDILSYEDGKYSYCTEDSSRTRTAKLSENAAVLYNGQIPPIDFSSDDYCPADGYIELVDQNNDARYDAVFIWNFETYVVKEVTAQTKSITDFFGKEKLLLDEDLNKCRVVISKNGEKADISEIERFNILLVAKGSSPADKTLYTIKASDKLITGRVERMNDEEVVIDGESYTISRSFSQSVKTDRIYDYYFDDMGRIAFYNEGSGDNQTKYGILLKVITKEELEIECSMRIYNEQGIVEEIKLADKVRLDGESVKAEKIAEHPFLTKIGGTQKQLIGYRVNADGLIKVIDTANQGVNEDKNDSLQQIGIYDGAYYLDGGPAFDESFVVAPGAKVFKVPADSPGVITDDMSFDYLYGIGVVSTWFRNTYSYDVQSFRTDEGLPADIIVYYVDKVNSAQFKGPLMVVSDASPAVNDAGDVEYTLSGYINNGEKASFYCYDRAVEQAMTVSKGDIIQYELVEDKVDSVVIRYDADGENQYNISRPLVTADPRVIYGQITKVDGQYMLLSYTKDANGSVDMSAQKPYNMQYAQIMKLVNGKVERGYLTDLAVGREMVLKMSGGRVQYAVLLD